MKSPLHAAIYARISLDREGERAGVTRQIEDCTALIADRGWELVETYVDNSISAASGARRPAYERLLGAIEEGRVQAVVAWSPDRLHRRLADLDAFVDVVIRAECRTVTVKAGDLDLDTAAGRTIARILGSIAAGESETKSERVRRRREQEARQGRAHGPLGYGYNADRSINPDEAAVVREVADRLLRGESLFGVAQDLNERGVASPGAGRWTARMMAREYGRRPEIRPLVDALRNRKPTTAATAARLVRQAGGRASAQDVREDDLLRRWLLEAEGEAPEGQVALVLQGVGVPAPVTSWRAANLGVMIRRGALCGWRDFGPGKRGGRGEMVAEGDWTPILTKETSEAIRALLDARKGPLRIDGKPRGGRQPKFLLTSILRCGRCGGPLNGMTDRGRVTYSCTRVPQSIPPRCGRLTISGALAEEAVTAVVLAALSNADLRRGRSSGPDAKDEEEARTSLLAIRSEMQTYARAAGARQISPAEYLEIRAGLDARMREAERVLGERAEQVRAALTGVPTTPTLLRDWWESQTLARQRGVIQALIESVPVAPANPAPGAPRREATIERLGEPVWRI